MISVDVGLTLGASWLRQSFATPGEAPTRNTAAAKTSVGAGVALDLAAGFYLFADAAAETYLFALEDATRRTTTLTPSLAFRHHLGVGKHW